MSSDDLPPVYTIGHSTRSIAEFVELLGVGQVSTVVDVRSIPRSRTNPQYNLDRLPAELSERQIGHTYLAALGGLRKRSREMAPEVNGFWRNESFHDYADYALSAEFETGLARLLEISADRRCAIMCAEAVWWRCHRRIVADYLLLRGRRVLHLLAPARAEPARMTPAARRVGNVLSYPAELQSDA